MASTPAPNNANSSDFGDIVGSDDECEVETDAEPRSRYWDHLYCPLSIGEVLNARYRIEHKLGWGGFSTVWLAHDIHANKAVALKVVVSGERAEHERAIQDDIKRNVRDASNLVIYQALFYYPGREGRYYAVFVFPVRGPSLDAACSRLPPKFRVPAARSLLLALKSLHDAGIIHRGKFTWNESLHV
jgi:serine/threonine protein kinase